MLHKKTKRAVHIYMDILSMKQPQSFYINLAKKESKTQNYSKVVKLLLQSVDIENTNGENYLMLGKTYAKMKLLSISNTYFFLAIPYNAQESYLGLGKNYYDMGVYDLGNLYLNKCIMEGNNGNDTATQAKRIINKNKGKTSLKIVNKEDEFLHKLKDNLNNKKIEDAIDYLSQFDSNDKAVKTALVLLSYLTGDFDKAIDVITENGTKEAFELNELADLTLFYYHKKDKNKMMQYAKMLEDAPMVTLDHVFKKAITFGNVEMHSKACDFFEEFLEYTPYNCMVILLLAIGYINLERYDQAKEILLKAYNIDPIKSTYKFYLDIAESQIKNRYLYINEIPRKAMIEYDKIIKKILEQPQKDIDKAFSTNKIFDIIESLCCSNSYINKDVILYELTQINIQKIKYFLKFLLLSEIISTDSKLKIARGIIKNSKEKHIALCIDGIYYTFKIPPHKLLKGEWLDIYSQAQLYVLTCGSDDVSINSQFGHIYKYAIDKDIDKYVLISSIVWLAVEGKSKLKLEEVCNHFLVLPEEVRKVIDEVEKKEGI